MLVSSTNPFLFKSRSIKQEQTRSNSGAKYGAIGSEGYVVKGDFREDMMHDRGHQR